MIWWWWKQKIIVKNWSDEHNLLFPAPVTHIFHMKSCLLYKKNFFSCNSQYDNWAYNWHRKSTRHSIFTKSIALPIHNAFRKHGVFTFVLWQWVMYLPTYLNFHSVNKTDNLNKICIVVYAYIHSDFGHQKIASKIFCITPCKKMLILY